MMSRDVVAIDGPSASGKSTTAREVAATLGLVHLNSGLLYRTITWIALRDRWSSSEDFADGLAGLDVSLIPNPPEFELQVDGSPVGSWLQSAEVNARVSEVAAREEVRRWVFGEIRQASESMGLVIDGRDIGTAVFPDAILKVYLTASPDERARRRLGEAGTDPTESDLSAEVARLGERDHLDATRDLAPLVKADDAIELDTTHLTASQVVDRIVGLYRDRRPSGS
jgi:cytidylate kinase